MNKQFFKILLLLFIIVSNSQTFAQEQLRSTRLLKDNDIEELYQVIQTSNGFVGLGMKGDDALNRKLWLLHFNEKMEVQQSVILSNQTLTDPFKIIKLQNGNSLILAQHESDNKKQSILFCIDRIGSILWAKSLNDNGNSLFLDMALSEQNELVLVGKEYMKNTLALDRDKVVLLKMNMNGGIIFQKKIEMGPCEISPKQIFIDNQNNILVNGSLTQFENQKVFDKQWFALKLNSHGEKIGQLQINDYSNYNYATNFITYNGGYLAVLNDKNFFGQPAIVELNNDLNIKRSFTFNGSPILLSGVTAIADKLIFAGVFSNTLNDYSPGYIMYDSKRNSIIAKSSPSLFKHFFVTNVLNLSHNQFMLSGIGYNENEASDVYILPFTSDGNSACNLNSYSMSKEALNIVPIANSTLTNEFCDVKIQTIELISSETGYTMADICTAPDDYVIDPSKNKSWSAWKDNNKEAFTFIPPTDWLDVSPSPAHDKVTVSYSGMKNTDQLRLTILNNGGKIIYSEVYWNQDIFEVDLSSFSNGIYFFNVYDGFESRVKKVVKE